MRPRDARVAGWSAAAFIVCISVFCALMGEGCSHDLTDWWQQRGQSQQEGK